MTATQLPHEVLAHVASYLSVNEQSRCNTVCKKRNTIFAQLLWSPININIVAKIHVFYDSCEENYLQWGHIVNSLRVATDDIVTDKHLANLQKCFPNITSLSIWRLITKDANKKADWNN
ncbi:hypothetical protein F4703DRAFT_1933513 [Phycomyces blakesleeanus]|uniref:F-box domain-containing protein n=1 Tax=Phycomyces blakesleeanus (strain ATCC 8743b / DSM 1359 / FGSC 10004 / NBRC 33097 / NRRL 1555) TaxID=763407 RepID=A0A163AB90_PHYB8|nr:hypothetical protein PHYBLDRAFT_146504 [Phycomyces blakesleeanus NRRL 1555(-)]OAD72301.1 hypothetical protein PHYBLDRAFT_146504 [Phycomyces blakesleeanus NRRL 1555(-)]|eukprot:XP_018290341.1 hypothetical protein PHYBLDRAFT_146504 [Phycomyces blakesleeanus NRRL 1555(-)]